MFLGTPTSSPTMSRASSQQSLYSSDDLSQKSDKFSVRNIMLTREEANKAIESPDTNPPFDCINELFTYALSCIGNPNNMQIITDYLQQDTDKLPQALTEDSMEQDRITEFNALITLMSSKVKNLNLQTDTQLSSGQTSALLVSLLSKFINSCVLQFIKPSDTQNYQAQGASANVKQTKQERQEQQAKLSEQPEYKSLFNHLIETLKKSIISFHSKKLYLFTLYLLLTQKKPEKFNNVANAVFNSKTSDCLNHDYKGCMAICDFTGCIALVTRELGDWIIASCSKFCKQQPQGTYRERVIYEHSDHRKSNNLSSTPTTLAKPKSKSDQAQTSKPKIAKRNGSTSSNDRASMIKKTPNIPTKHNAKLVLSIDSNPQSLDDVYAMPDSNMYDLEGPKTEKPETKVEKTADPLIKKAFEKALQESRRNARLQQPTQATLNRSLSTVSVNDGKAEKSAEEPKRRFSMRKKVKDVAGKDKDVTNNQPGKDKDVTNQPAVQSQDDKPDKKGKGTFKLGSWLKKRSASQDSKTRNTNPKLYNKDGTRKEIIRAGIDDRGSNPSSSRDSSPDSLRSSNPSGKSNARASVLADSSINSSMHTPVSTNNRPLPNVPVQPTTTQMQISSIVVSEPIEPTLAQSAQSQSQSQPEQSVYENLPETTETTETTIKPTTAHGTGFNHLSPSNGNIFDEVDSNSQSKVQLEKDSNPQPNSTSRQSRSRLPKASPQSLQNTAKNPSIETRDENSNKKSGRRTDANGNPIAIPPIPSKSVKNTEQTNKSREQGWRV